MTKPGTCLGASNLGVYRKFRTQWDIEKSNKWGWKKSIEKDRKILVVTTVQNQHKSLFEYNSKALYTQQLLRVQRLIVTLRVQFFPFFGWLHYLDFVCCYQVHMYLLPSYSPIGSCVHMGCAFFFAVWMKLFQSYVAIWRSTMRRYMTCFAVGLLLHSTVWGYENTQRMDLMSKVSYVVFNHSSISEISSSCQFLYVDGTTFGLGGTHL